MEHAQAIVRFAKGKCQRLVDEAGEKVVLYPELIPVPDAQPKTRLGRQTEIVTRQCTTVDAGFAELGEDERARVCLLNFASYKEPGGMFLYGSMAQEESLCHASLLYPVLSSARVTGMFYHQHKKMLNRALYHSDLLYAPEVPFYRGGEQAAFDIITCAAPNKGTAQKYQNVPDREVEQAMRHRIDSILYSAWDQEAQALILGAFGCGVFKNDITFVSRCFRDLLQGKYKDCFQKVVFAVPDGKSFRVMQGILEG